MRPQGPPPPPPYEPRRALPDEDFDVLDDFQRLLVALEQLAVEWTVNEQRLRMHGASEQRCADYRVRTNQLRELAREHARSAA